MSTGDISIHQEYIATGEKYKKETQGSANDEIRYYLSGVEFVNGKPESYPFGDGRLMWEEDDNGVWKGRPQYRITHHLGNSMVFFDDKNDDGSLTTELDIANNTDGTLTADDLEVVQRLWYYPFGMHLQGIGQLDVDPSQRYRYNGKEWDESVGLYDYGARYYDPAIARWTSVDALADDPMQVDKSPYAYAWNNPVQLTAPDGNCPLCAIIKGAAGAGIDYFLQGAFNYASGLPTDQAWQPANIDLSDVAWSGVTGALPWSVPGGKYSKAAAAAFGDVSFNFIKAEFRGEEYSLEQAGQDFFIGFAAQLGPERIQEFINSKLPKARKNSKLAGRTHPKTGVPFDSRGFPDFSDHLYGGGPNSVNISPTGNRSKDFSAANEAAGYSSTPKGYTWHHHQNYGRMELVESSVHRRTGHDGGFSLWDSMKWWQK